MQVEATFDCLGVQPTAAQLRVVQQVAQGTPLRFSVLALAEVNRDATINLQQQLGELQEDGVCKLDCEFRCVTISSLEGEIEKRIPWFDPRGSEEIIMFFGVLSVQRLAGFTGQTPKLLEFGQ